MKCLIGLHHLAIPRDDTVDRIANELDSAFSTVGFVYLRNHGIEQKTVQDLAALQFINIFSLFISEENCRSMMYFELRNRSSGYRMSLRTSIDVVNLIANLTDTQEKTRKCNSDITALHLSFFLN